MRITTFVLALSCAAIRFIMLSRLSTRCDAQIYDNFAARKR